MLSMAIGVGVRIVSNYKGTCRLTGAFFLCYNISIKIGPIHKGGGANE